MKRTHARRIIPSFALALALAMGGAAGAWANSDLVPASVDTGSFAAAESVSRALANADIPADYSWYDASATSFTLADEGAGKMTANKLAGLRNIVNGTAQVARDSFYNKTVTLADDVNFAGLEWTPIGDAPDHAFQGTFDGAGHEVGGFQITSTYANAGLFGVAGTRSTLKDVRVSAGNAEGIKIGESEEAAYEGGKVQCVGTLAGDARGAVLDCSSSMNVTVYNSTPVTDELPTIVDGLGGLVGRCSGSISGCSYAGDLYLYSASDTDSTRDQGYLIMTCIGGVVGFFGDMAHPGTNTAAIADCENTGRVRVNTAGFAEGDRFGEAVVSQAGYVGGIAGYSTGSVLRCENRGSVDTSYRMAIEIYGTNIGAAGSYIGGVVGSLRADIFPGMASPVEGAFDAGTASEGNPIYVSQCVNSGSVFGNHAVGGIAGVTGWYANVVGCSCDIDEGSADPTSADYLLEVGGVKGARWNKPMVGGIVGKSYGTIAYCYNRSRVWSTTDAGYYVAGIAGVMFRGTSIAGYTAPLPETYACYNTGFAQSGLRAASIAGQNEGYIHDCYALPETSYHGENADEKLVFSQYATVARTEFVDVDVLRGSEGAAKLNFLAADENWERCFVPAASDAVNDGFPVLWWQDSGSVTDLSGLSSSIELSLVRDADYTGGAAAPTLKAVLHTDSGDVTLVQNADFKVVTAPDAIERTLDADRTTGTRPYTATIVGMGRYEGAPSNSVKYGIIIGDISACTFAGIERVFTGQPIELSAADVVLYTPSGAIVPSDRYTFQVNDGQPCTARGSYKIVATAVGGEGSNYQGTLSKSGAFTIAPANLYSDCVIQGVSANGEAFDADHLDAMRFTYTGKPIYPTVDAITYAPEGAEPYTLVLGAGVTSWGADYYVSYQSAGNYTDVTADGERCNIDIQAVAPDTIGSFHNYVDLFFQIVPADISAASISVPDQAYTGQPRGVAVIEFNGATLVEGVDYTVAFTGNVEVGSGTANAHIEGMGNFKGSADVPFSILDVPTTDLSTCTVSDIPRQGWTGEPVAPAMSVRSADGELLAQGRDYVVSYADNVDAGTAVATIIGCGTYAGQVEQPFQVVAHTVTVGAPFEARLNYPNFGLDGAATTRSTTTPVVYTRGLGARVVFTAYRSTWGDYTNRNLTGVTVQTASGADVPVTVLSTSNDSSTSGTNRIVAAFTVPDEDVKVTGLTYTVATKDLAQCTVEPIADQDYTGGAVKPVPLVAAADGTPLAEGRDFAVLRYRDNVNVGTATVTIVGTGDYIGYQDASFKIRSDRTLAVSAADVTVPYDGLPHGGVEPEADDPAATFRYGLSPDSCTLSSCPTFTDAGTYTVYFEAYVPAAMGTGSAQVTITRREVVVTADDSIKVVGSADPRFSAVVTGVLPADAGTLSYALSRPGAGTDEAEGTYEGAIVATGAEDQGNYHVTFVPGTMRIVRQGAEFLNVVGEEAVYDGRPHAVEATTGVEGAEIRYGLSADSFTLAAPPEFTDAGTYIVYVRASAGGSVFAQGSATVTIAKRRATVAARPASKVYGDANPPASSLAADATGFLEGEVPGYSIALVGVSETSEAGVYEGSVRVSATGDVPNYAVNWKAADFTVNPRPIAGASVTALRDHVHDGQAYQPYPDVMLGGKALSRNVDFKVSYRTPDGAPVAAPTGIGSYECVVTGIGNYSGEEATAFRILGDLSKATVSASDQTYTGSAISPAVTVRLDGATVPDTGYDVAYSNNTAVGTATVTVTGKGLYTGTATGAFSIKAAGQQMHRLYNPNSGEHFYTADEGERDSVIAAGWKYEGIGWTAPAASNTPVYRLYNRHGGEHHYTADKSERDALIGVGWTDEGIGWHSDDAKAVPLYREYNPNAYANNHNYTTSKEEHEWLLSLGWRDEGYAWYGVK